MIQNRLFPFLFYAFCCFFLGTAENIAKLNFMREGTNLWSILLIQGIVFTLFGAGALMITKTSLQFTYLNWVYASLIFAYCVGYLFAIKMLPVSIAVPFGQLAAIITVVIAVIFLHEVLRPVHIVGIALVIVGATLLTVK